MSTKRASKLKCDKVEPKKTKVFKLLKVPRLLIGPSPKNVVETDLRTYNDHRRKMFYIKPVVDSRPENFPISRYFKQTSLKKDTANLYQIEKENERLVFRINKINRTKGEIDSFNPDAYRNSSQWRQMESRLEQLGRENERLYTRLINTKATYPKHVFDKYWKENKIQLQKLSKFNTIEFKEETKDSELKRLPSICSKLNIDKTYKRKICFFEFRIEDSYHLGRIAVMLYDDLMPITVSYFLNAVRDKENGYKNSLVYKIHKDKYCVIGKPWKYDCTTVFIDKEENQLKHTKGGVLSMVPIDEYHIGRQFSITFKRMSELDRKHVVIGKVIWGAINFFKLNQLTNKYGHPYANIIITNCGVKK